MSPASALEPCLTMGDPICMLWRTTGLAPDKDLLVCTMLIETPCIVLLIASLPAVLLLSASNHGWKNRGTSPLDRPGVQVEELGLYTLFWLFVRRLRTVNDDFTISVVCLFLLLPEPSEVSLFEKLGRQFLKVSIWEIYILCLSQEPEPDGYRHCVSGTATGLCARRPQAR